MKKQSISFKSNVVCLEQENMSNCSQYDPKKRGCSVCDAGFSLKVEIKETVIDTVQPAPTAKTVKTQHRRLLEATESPDEDKNRLSSIDDSNKEVVFETIKSCQAKADIANCLEHSPDKQTCILCETGRIYNNDANECQFIMLVPRGCLKYGPYNSCYRCIKDYYLNEVHDCAPVEKPVMHCHLYNTFQKCSLCRKGFALSRDKSR